MVLQERQTNRETKQNREPINKPHKYFQLIFYKGTKQVNGVKMPFQNMLLEQLESHRPKPNKQTNKQNNNKKV